MGLTVGAGAAAALYGLTMASGSGRWQAGLLAQTALIGVALQLGYRQRAPVDLIHIANADKGLHAVLIGAIAFWANLVLEGRVWRVGRAAVPVAILVPLVLAAAKIGPGPDALAPSRWSRPARRRDWAGPVLVAQRAG